MEYLEQCRQVMCRVGARSRSEECLWAEGAAKQGRHVRRALRFCAFASRFRPTLMKLERVVAPRIRRTFNPYLALVSFPFYS